MSTPSKAKARVRNSLATQVLALERSLIKDALKKRRGNVTHTARDLGISQQALSQKLHGPVFGDLAKLANLRGPHREVSDEELLDASRAHTTVGAAAAAVGLPLRTYQRRLAAALKKAAPAARS